jgi:hypothetical protein
MIAFCNQFLQIGCSSSAGTCSVIWGDPLPVFIADDSGFVLFEEMARNILMSLSYGDLFKSGSHRVWFHVRFFGLYTSKLSSGPALVPLRASTKDENLQGLVDEVTRNVSGAFRVVLSE